MPASIHPTLSDPLSGELDKLYPFSVPGETWQPQWHSTPALACPSWAWEHGRYVFNRCLFWRFSSFFILIGALPTPALPHALVVFIATDLQVLLVKSVLFVLLDHILFHSLLLVSSVLAYLNEIVWSRMNGIVYNVLHLSLLVLVFCCFCLFFLSSESESHSTIHACKCACGVYAQRMIHGQPEQI